MGVPRLRSKLWRQTLTLPTSCPKRPRRGSHDRGGSGGAFETLDRCNDRNTAIKLGAATGLALIAGAAASVVARSKKLNLRGRALYRFVKFVSPDLSDPAVPRATIEKDCANGPARPPEKLKKNRFQRGSGRRNARLPRAPERVSRKHAEVVLSSWRRVLNRAGFAGGSNS